MDPYWHQRMKGLNRAHRITFKLHDIFSALLSVFAYSKSSGKETAAISNDVGKTAVRLLHIYGDSVLRMAYSYLHNMNDAEEILQDTLIKYLQAAPSFKSTSHEKAWLLRVASNLSKNRIDYNRLRDTDELNEALIANEREDLSYVWEAVKELPDGYREAIHLFYYEGYDTAEIAKILHRKESTIRSDLRKGREKLKCILKEAYDFE